MNDKNGDDLNPIDSLIAGLDPARLQLLQEKFGTRLTWRPPKVEKTVGPFDLSPFVRYQTGVADLVQACSEHLRTKPDDVIAAMAAKKTEEAKQLRRDWFDFHREPIDRLHKAEPPWYAAGLGHSDHIANFDYWAKMSNFSWVEMTCVSIGVSPDSLPTEAFQEFTKAKKADLWPAQRFLIDRLAQLGREFGSSYLHTKIFPAKFLLWAERMEFEVHPDFWQLLKKYHGGRQAAADADAEQPTRKPDKREIDTIAQLFTLMAIDQLGYRPGNKRSTAPKEICDLAAKHGGSVSEETVRKYLRIGSRFLSDAAKDGHI